MSGSSTETETLVAAAYGKRIVNEKAAFKPIEQWVGRVETVDRENGAFTAVVKSNKADIGDEIAQFSFDELSEDDQALILEGAIFYWNVGYRIEPFGQRSTESIIRFRRLPVWKPREIAEAKKRAEARLIECVAQSQKREGG